MLQTRASTNPTHRDLLQSAQVNEILKMEQIGDTLVVTPAGDLMGYRHSAFEIELSQLKQLMRCDEVKNVIVNLGGSTYFGSEMIGACVALRKSEDAHVVFAEPSDELMVVFRTMGIAELLTIYDTLPAAIRDVATIPLGARIHRHRRMIGAVTVVGVVLLMGVASVYTGIFAPLIGTEHTRDYDKLMVAWDKLLLSDPELHIDVNDHQRKWKEYMEFTNSELPDVITRYESKRVYNEADEALLQAVRSLHELAQTPFYPEGSARTAARSAVADAAEAIEEELGSEIERPKETATLTRAALK